ncbi:MAG: sigma-70 family RNA polymerase sigma factor [Flammeovirgaceae bacterium]|nr:sigma-70 family RNA polymerase sigma factor [Flammeovirgaceae bacterium]
MNVVRTNEGDYKVWIDLKNGNREALEYIINQYYSDLYFYGVKLSKKPEISEDCIQEVLITLWEKRNSLNTVYNLKSYLFKSLKRRIIRVLSAQKKEEAQQENLRGVSAEFSFSTEDKMIGQQETLENQQKLITALSKLSNRQKEIVYLKYYQGLNYDEIAEVMLLKRQSVHNLLQEAVKSLRKNFFCLGYQFSIEKIR